MKPVYKCDYCTFMGTEEEVKEHEEKCNDNYTKRSCLTCKSRKTCMTYPTVRFECERGKEIPNGCIIENCEYYERKEKDIHTDKSIFSNLFGGI